MHLPRKRFSPEEVEQGLSKDTDWRTVVCVGEFISE